MTNDHRGNVLGTVRFLCGNDQILLVVLGQATHRLHAGRLLDRGRQIVVCQSLRGEAGWIGNDLDLPHVARLYIHPTHPRNARDQRPELVSCDVV